jgi:hypothetical protein
MNPIDPPALLRLKVEHAQFWDVFVCRDSFSRVYLVGVPGRKRVTR